MSRLPAGRLLLGAFALALVYWAIAVSGPDVVGFWGDDGIYVATARSLAESEGYRHAELPGEPLQTKYPILYPALLAPAFVAASYPANLPLLLLPGALGAGALVALSALYWRRILDEPPQVVWTLALLCAISPVVVSFVRFAMSEFVYGALAAAAALLLDQRAEMGGARRTRLRTMSGAALVGLAVLTRSIGISLAAAAVVAPLLRRRPGEAAQIGGVVLAITLPWWIWQGLAGAENGALQTARLYAYDLGYSSWLPESALETLRVAGHNALRVALALGYEHLALPGSLVAPAIVEPSWRTLLLHLFCDAALLLAVAGFLASARRAWGTLHIYALAYAGLVLAWPFEPGRFLVPWTPFLLYFVFAGLREAARLVGQSGTRPRALLARLGQVCAAVLVVAFVVRDARIVASTEERYVLPQMPAGYAPGERRALERWLADNTDERDVVASLWPAGIFLRTGRQGFLFWPDHDPVEVYYGRDRSALQLTALPAPSEAEAIRSDLRSELADAYREGGVDWYVESRHSRDAAILTGVAQALRPGWLRPVWTSPGRTLRVHRVRGAGSESRNHPVERRADGG